MIQKSLLKPLLFIALAIFVLILWKEGVDLPTNFYALMSAAVTAAAVIYALFELYLWRLPVVSQLLSLPPDIQGTWKGQIDSFWVDPETKLTPPPFDVYAVIRQTSSSINVRMFTAKSSSDTMAAHIDTQKGTHTIWAVFLNTPHLQFRDRSPIHHGGFMITLIGSPVQRLSGSYWTDRKTTGNITFSAKSKTITDDFESAAALEYQAD